MKHSLALVPVLILKEFVCAKRLLLLLCAFSVSCFFFQAEIVVRLICGLVPAGALSSES